MISPGKIPAPAGGYLLAAANSGLKLQHPDRDSNSEMSRRYRSFVFRRHSLPQFARVDRPVLDRTGIPVEN
jgi:hypothetical protein